MFDLFYEIYNFLYDYIFSIIEDVIIDYGAIGEPSGLVFADGTNIHSIYETSFICFIFSLIILILIIIVISMFVYKLIIFIVRRFKV